MKKKNAFKLAGLLFFFVLSVAPAFSQIIRYGIKGGIDVAEHKVNSELLKVKNRVGFQIGGTLEANVPLTGFGVETGLFYGNKNYDVSDNQKKGDISNLSYLTIPISLKKRFSILGVAGIYISGGVFGNIRTGGGELKIDNEEYNQKGFQTGIVAGAGVSLLNHLDLGMNYRYKFTDTYSADAAKDFAKIGRDTWTVSLAYLF